MGDTFKTANMITVRCERLSPKDPWPWFAHIKTDDHSNTFHCSRSDDPVKAIRRALNCLVKDRKRAAKKGGK